MADKKISALTAATTPLAGTEVLPIVQSSTTVNVSVSNLTAGRNTSMAKVAAGTTSFNHIGTVAGDMSTSTYIGDNNVAPFVVSGITNAGKKLALGYNTTANEGVIQAGITGVSVSPLKLNPSGGDVGFGANLVQGTAAKGVNFTANTPAAGMTSQLLNWYEEGTFNATISDGTNNATMNATRQKCAYVRIGRQVTITGYVATTSMTGVTGNLRMTGLPFTVANSGEYYGGGAVTYAASLAITAGQSVTMVPAINGTHAAIYVWSATTGTAAMTGSQWNANGEIIFTLIYFTS